MATRIRLKRIGARHNPHFRVVIMDQRKRRDGRTVEEIGQYNPSTDPATVVIDADRARHWLALGAVPSETVSHLLKRAGVVEGGGEAPAAPAPAEAVEEASAEAQEEEAAVEAANEAAIAEGPSAPQVQ